MNSKKASHNSPDVLGPLLPGVRAKSKRIGDDFGKMPSRTRLEIRSQYSTLNYDLGASTLDAPPPPWEAQPPRGVELSTCMPAALLVDLCCRALDCRHVCVVHSFERPVGCSSPTFYGCIYLFLYSQFGSVSTPRPEHCRKRVHFDYALRFQFCLDYSNLEPQF